MTSTLPVVPVSQKESDPATATKKEGRTTGNGALVAGSVRGTIWLLIKRLSLKTMMRKRAFMTIGKQADSSLATKQKTGGGSAHPQVSSGGKSNIVSSSRSYKVLAAAKGMIQGVIVFGTYDGCMTVWETLNEDGIGSDEASVVVHGGSGATAGLARSLVWMGWEQWVARVEHSDAFRFRTTCHHSACFGSLFGSYQATQYVLMKCLTDDESQQQKRRTLLTTGVAGGFGGMVHHVVHHYTSYWRHFQPTIAPLPGIRPTVASFGPMALCFLALEYGGDGAENVWQRAKSVLD